MAEFLLRRPLQLYEAIERRLERRVQPILFAVWVEVRLGERVQVRLVEDAELLERSFAVVQEVGIGRLREDAASRS